MDATTVGTGRPRAAARGRDEEEDGGCRMCGSSDLRGAGTVRGYDFVECARCGLVFAPEITDAHMAELYREGYHGPADGAPEVGWADSKFLRPALALAGPGRLRVLDFGTGQSLIPDLLRGQGHRVVAVDVVPPARPHPDRLTGDLPELELEPARFDLAYTFQVFEHLPEPRRYLEELLRLVRPGGLVHVHTDMETPERADGFTSWWYVLPPDHCTFYRHRTFEHLLRGTPHRIVFREPKAVTIEVGAP